VILFRPSSNSFAESVLPGKTELIGRAFSQKSPLPPFTKGGYKSPGGHMRQPKPLNLLLKTK
jgi:hypothetical protein